MLRVTATLLLAAFARAGEGDKAMARARAAYAAWQDVAGKGAPAPDPSDSPAMRRFKRSGPTAADVNRASFGSAFAKTDFDAWDPVADRDLLREGLLLAARLEDRPDVAIRAGELFVARFPDHDAVPEVRGGDLPVALAVAGDVERARTLARAHAGNLVGLRGARAMLLLGDLEVAAGNREAARGAYDHAFGLTADDPDAKGPVDVRTADWDVLRDRSANRTLREEIEVRRARFGTKLGTLRRDGVGPVGAALARGPHRVALWFFSPSEQDDLDRLTMLDRLARALGDDRLRVVGVTWFENLAGANRNEPWMLDPEGKRAVVKPHQLKRGLATLRAGLGLAAPLAIVREDHSAEWVGKRQERLLLVADADQRVLFASRAGETPLTLALVRAFVPGD